MEISRQHELMSASTPLALLPEDKLDVLSYLDEFHFWYSLDDKRFCKRCGRSITGRQILVMELQGRRGQLRLQCPTVGCVSTASEWVYADPASAASLKNGFRPGPRPSETKSAADSEQTHHSHIYTVRRVKRAREKYDDGAAARRHSPALAHAVSFRAVLRRLALLRPIASGLRAIHPVA